MNKRIITITIVSILTELFSPCLKTEASAAESFLWPVDGIYGMSRGYYSGHNGIDILAPNMTPVRATKSGWVYYSVNNCPHTHYSGDPEHPAGNYVQLVHDDGSGGSRYLHLAYGTAISSSSNGSATHVKQGDIIGYSGSSGDSDGYHLHFELLSDGTVWTSSYNNNPVNSDGRHYASNSSTYTTETTAYIYNTNSAKILNSYICDLTVETAVNNCSFWSMPGNSETYPESHVVGKMTQAGMTFHATRIIENIVPGHYWYETTYPPTGTTCYVWINNTRNPSQNWTVNASEVSKPGNLSLGQTFDVRGIVSTGGAKMTKLRGYIYPGNSTSGIPNQTSNEVSPNNDSYDLRGIDLSLYFDRVSPAGYYTYTVKVDLSGYTISNGKPVEQSKSNIVVADVTTYYRVGTTSNIYTVSYNANGGTGAPESQTAASNSAITLSSVRPSRSNSVENYTVTLDANGGSVSTNSLAAAHTTSFSFKNWNTAANGSGTSYSPGAVYSSDSSVTLYAQWDTTTRTDTVVLPTPTREHYTFMGWGLSSTASNGVTGSYTPNGNVTLYALWESIQYTITYDANGGINPPASQKKNEGVPISLSYQRPPDRESERLMCVGWATSRTATEAEYLFGGRFYTDADTTLYAVWKKYYYIYYNANGGGLVPMSGFHYGDFTIPDWPPEYDGYRFVGWSLSESADSIDYQPGDSVHFEQDTTLYAVWQRVYYSDWSETRPEGVDESIIETKTQYRYSTRETTTDTVSSKPGWTQAGSQQIWGNYGDWSSWSLDAVSKSDSCDVDTGPLYRYYYFYCAANCGRHEPYSGYCDCGAQIIGYSVKWSHIPYNQSNPVSYDNRKMYTMSLGDGQRWNFSSGNLNSSAIGTKDVESDATVIDTGYRYRTRSQSTVYNFERWTDWSEWSDTPIEASDSKRVEPRTLYRCKIDEDRVLTLPGALTKIESEAFRNIAADAVVIPESVRSIADDAFNAGIVIIGKTNSYAQLYAGWNNLLFIPSDDLNG